MKRLLAALFLLLPAAGAFAAPKLVVVVSVDQMRADYLDLYAEEYLGGLKTLREQGAVFTDAQHVHVPTETGPGHAVISTGKFPAQTGIVGNSWWDRDLSTTVYVVADSAHGLGPEHLMAYTLGDALKAKGAPSRKRPRLPLGAPFVAIKDEAARLLGVEREPESTVISLSVKDRAAILMGGKKADAALWYDRKKGEFATSSYYRRPSWLDGFNRGLKKPRGFLFTTPANRYAELVYTPKADRLLLLLVKEALRRERLGKGQSPDLLMVSFSATDYIGHKYGPDSRQMHEQMLRLDAVLDDLIQELDSRVGREHYDIVLTADHGVAPMPESPGGREINGKRLLWDDCGHAFESVLETEFQTRGRVLLSWEFPNVYLDRSLARKLGVDWPAFLRRAAKAMKTVIGVAEVYLPDDIDPADPYAEVYRRSVMPARSGDLLVRFSPGIVVTDDPRGTDHGTPYPYDTHVPLIFWGPDFKSGQRAQPAWVADVAPTLGVLLGVDFPPVPGSRAHREIFKEAP